MARTPAATRSPFQKEPEGIRDRSDPGDRDLRPDLRCRPSPENVADQHLRARQCGVGGPPPAACRWSATWGVAASKSGPTLVSLPREVLARHVSPGGARWRRARCPRRGDRGPGSSRCGLGGGPRGDPGHPPQLGSWDLGGAWLAGRGHRFVTVVEPLRPPRLLRWFLDTRRQFGITALVRGPGVRDELAAALERNQIVVLVCDRDLGGRGPTVRFFGELTTLPPVPHDLRVAPARRSSR